MRNRQWYAGALALGLVTAGGALLRAQTADTPIKENSRARLHNGWQVTPAGTHQKIGTLPLGMALSPDKTTYALVNGGFGEPHLYLLDAGSGQIRQTIALERAWNGVAWSPDGATLYVSGGSFPRIHVFTRGADGAFQPGEPLTLPGLVADPPEANGTKPDKNQPKAYVAGLALSPDGKTLYAANFATDTIYALELATRTVKTQKTLAKNAHPYCLRLSPDGSELYATQGALGSIAVLRADDLTPARLIATDKHPNDLAFAPDGRMFVSCGSSNDVLAIDPASGEIRERISTTLTPHAPAGTTPNALAFAPDGNTLFVADSDNNNVAVLDVSSPGSSRARGFIPTGWYPSAVGVSPDGKTLFLGTGKGMGTGPNAPTGQSPVGKRKRDYPYIGELLYGMLSTVSVPDETQLAAYTRQVMANTPYRDSLLTQPVQAPKPGTSPIPSRLGDPSPIKHVLYIIKENRTYDQVLGDMKEGNGDPQPDDVRRESDAQYPCAGPRVRAAGQLQLQRRSVGQWASLEYLRVWHGFGRAGLAVGIFRQGQLAADGKRYGSAGRSHLGSVREKGRFVRLLLLHLDDRQHQSPYAQSLGAGLREEPRHGAGRHFSRRFEAVRARQQSAPAL